MKRTIAIVLLIAVALSLTACGVALPYERTVSVNGLGDLTFVVDPLHRTITQGEDEYQYVQQGPWVVITYPSGGIYRENPQIGYSGQSGITNHIPGNVLVSVLTEEALETVKEPWVVAVSAIFGLMGLWHVLLPRKSLFILAYGWGVWKAEESPGNVRAIRLVGAAMVAAALFCIVFA